MSISGLFLCTVIISALLLIHSTQKILFNNATNYVDMASDKFSNELDVLCLQLDVITSHIQSDSLYQELLSTPDYHSLAPYTISEISQNVSYLKSLYPDIVDIAFANDLVHWSALFSESDLHTLYEEALNCSHIYSNGRSIGCAFISPDINKLNMEGFFRIPLLLIFLWILSVISIRSVLAVNTLIPFSLPVRRLCRRLPKNPLMQNIL